MTFAESLKRKVHRIRLPFFQAAAYVDPRVTEQSGDVTYAPIIDPSDPPRDSAGRIRFAKVMVDEKTDMWQEVPVGKAMAYAPD